MLDGEGGFAGFASKQCFIHAYINALHALPCATFIPSPSLIPVHPQNVILQHEGASDMCCLARNKELLWTPLLPIPSLATSAEELEGQLVRAQHNHQARNRGDLRHVGPAKRLQHLESTGLIVIGLHLQGPFAWALTRPVP